MALEGHIGVRRGTVLYIGVGRGKALEGHIGVFPGNAGSVRGCVHGVTCCKSWSNVTGVKSWGKADKGGRTGETNHKRLRKDNNSSVFKAYRKGNPLV